MSDASAPLLYTLISVGFEPMFQPVTVRIPPIRGIVVGDIVTNDGAAYDTNTADASDV